MLLSLQKQFLFVHVPKTAGTTVQDTLLPWCEPPQRFLINRWLERVGLRVNYLGPFPRHRFRTHATARTAKFWLPREAYDGLFKFAFVRNPWDRMVSLYSYILARTDHHRRARVLKLQNFEAYLRFEIQRRTPTQTDMICDRRGQLLVDFVGRFERFSADFEQICARIGVDYQPLRKNSSSHEPYSYYYNDVTRRLVADYFAPDIERFGYEFAESDSSPVAPAA